MPRQTFSQAPNAPMPLINSSKFFQIPNHLAIRAIRAKLTSADWCLWSYLLMLDPGSNEMKPIPSPQDIAQAIDISDKQVRRSFTKLEEVGLYEVEIYPSERWRGKHVSA